MFFKEPDRNAPRFRLTCYNPIDATFIKDLKKKYPSLKKYSNIDIKRIIKKSNEAIWKSAIKNRDGIELESMLGYIFIGSCKHKKPNVDIYNSVKYGKLIQHRNLETDGNLAKIFYTNTPVKYKFAFQHLWGFEECRNFTTSVSKEYRKNWRKYISIPIAFRISDLFKFGRKTKPEINNTVEMYGFK